MDEDKTNLLTTEVQSTLSDGSGDTVTNAREAANGDLTSQKLFREEDIVAIINCTGWGARNFVGYTEANLLYQTQGEILIVKGEARCCRTRMGLPDMEDDEVIYVSPRPGTNTTIFGGRGRAAGGSWGQLNGFQ
jgi:hypothetical protein